MTTETILIIGGSFAGLGAAHSLLKNTVPQLPKKEGVTYNVTMVTPSKDFFWRIGAPRAVASEKLMPPSKMFYPIEPAFAYAKDNFTFVQGTATHVDSVGQTVSVQKTSGEQISIPYIALIIATGMTTPSPLFTQTSDRASVEILYKSFQTSLESATSVVIGGAGPVGVETAGEIAEFLNGKPGFFASEPKNPKARITLICAEKKMLPVLRESLSKQAEKLLKSLGCTVLYNTKVVTTTGSAGSKTTVELSNGEVLEADIYIDATGSRPNTGFLPKEWLDNRNRVQCNPKTLRVEAAGPRVYVVGDAGSYTRGGVMDMFDAIPAAMTNLKLDLFAHINGTPPSGERHYTPNLKEQQLVPIGTSKGVGAFNGNPIPSLMVWGIKGRDYMVGMLAQGTVNGDKFKSEGKWKAHPVQAAGETGLSSG